MARRHANARHSTRVRSLGFIASLCTSAALSGGCAAPDAAPARDGAGTFSVGSVAPEPLTPKAAYPRLLGSIEDERVFTIGARDPETDPQTKREIVTLATQIEGPDFWLIEHAADGSINYKQRLGLADNGAAVMHVMHNTTRNLRTEFEPPIVLLPAELRQGEPFEQQLTMKVYDQDAPRKPPRVGSATQRIELLGVDQAGAWMVRTTLNSEFGPAKIERITERTYASSTVRESAMPLGMVREHFIETVRVFGLTTEHTERLIQFAE